MNEINELMEHARQLQMRIDILKIDHIAALQKELDSTEEKIRAMASESMISIETMAGKVTFVKSSTRQNWDTKQLMEYAQTHPDVLAFLKTIVVAPHVKIKYNFEAA